MPLNKQSLFNQSNITEQEFLKTYWHKKPLLIKHAMNIDDLSCLPNKLELMRLSENEDIQSRIAIKKSEQEYEIEYGPFSQMDFNELNKECWNLLVSDVDKWSPHSRNILAYFTFIRNWIFDDIMVSTGSFDGTVGPHTDHYDVFLIQVHGQRQWSYGHSKIYNPELIPDQALKLMADFKANEKHVLNPGDILYLPPEIAHYGIAKSDDCVTCSIGIRTPSHAELITSFCDNIAQNSSANNRFEEPSFSKQPKQGKITQQDIDAIKSILINNLDKNTDFISNWFGQFITEYRSLFYEFNNYPEENSYTQHNHLVVNPFSKCSYIENNGCSTLFVNGSAFKCTLELSQKICNDKEISYLNLLNNNDNEIVKSLYYNGSLISK